MIRWHWLILAYLSLFVFGLADNCRGPVFPDLLKEYSLSDSAGSLFFLVTSASGLLNNVLASGWMNRIGAYRTLQVYTLLQAAALIGMAFSPGYSWLLAFSALLGASSGGLMVGQNVLTAEAVGPSARRQALSGLHCMYGVSSLMAPLVATGFYKWGFGWHSIFGWIGLAAASVLAFSFSGSGRSAKEPHSGERKASTVKRSRVFLYATIVGLYVVAEIALSSRLALFARRDAGMGVEEANFLLAGFFFLLFSGRLAFALVRFPWGNPAVLAASASLSLACFAFGLLAHPIWLSACGLAMSVFYPCVIALISEDMGEGAGLTISWSVTLESLGLVIMHFGLGALSDAFGLGRALWIGPSCLALLLFALVIRARG